MSYAKLFTSILQSSLWAEDSETKIVWITMLALSDRHGEVQASIPGLARTAGVSLESCQRAITKFLAPDEYSRTSDLDGRRIEVIDGGWALVNHAKYRRMASKADASEKHAARQARYRERKKASPGVTSDASVTHSDASVTHGVDIADADADADAKRESDNASAREASQIIASLPQSTPDAPVELPKAFPTSEAAAAKLAAFVGCPDDFAIQVWNESVARGGTDFAGNRILNFRAYLAARFAKERGRVAERQNGRAGGAMAAQGAAQAPWKRIKDLEAELKDLDGLLYNHMDRERNKDKVARREVVRAELSKLKGNP